MERGAGFNFGRAFVSTPQSTLASLYADSRACTFLDMFLHKNALVCMCPLLLMQRSRCACAHVQVGKAK